MKGPCSVFLVGMMASGKSTVGHALARRIGWEFFDVDREIEKRCGVPVSYIFEKEGEAGFRRREHRMVEELTARKAAVISMGGGVPMQEANRPCLRRGLVVAVEADEDILVERTMHDRTRPLLQGVDLRARIRSILADRAPVYRAVSDVTVNSSRSHPQEVVDRLLAVPSVRETVMRGDALRAGKGGEDAAG